MSSSSTVLLRTSLTLMALAVSQLSFAQESSSEAILQPHNTSDVVVVSDAAFKAHQAVQHAQKSAKIIAVQPATAINRNDPGQLDSKIPQDDALTQGQLDNGLKYFIYPNSTPSQRAELRLVVQAGSLNEKENERGLAHFMEHMVFNGSTHFPKHQMVDTLQDMGVKFGADLNAYTSFDETVYKLPIPLDDPKNLGTAMQVLEDWAFNATLETEEINKERPVITEEWRSSTQNARARQQEQMLSAVAKDSLYAKRDPIGDMKVVQNAAPQVLRDFYQRWYRPNLMSVIVVGDVNVAQTKALIEKHFGGHQNPSQPVVLPPVLVPNNVEPIISTFKDPGLTANTVMIYYKDKEVNQIDTTTGDYIRNLEESLVSRMLSFRLERLKESANPPFTAADSSRDQQLGGIVRTKQAYLLAAVAKAGHEAEALRALHQESVRVIQHGFIQTELDRAKRDMFANIEDYYLNRRKVESQDKAEEYIRGVTEHEPLPTIPWEYEAQKKYLPTITLAHINQLVKQHFTDDNRVVIINGNNQQQKLSDQQIKEIISDHSAQQAYQVEAPAKSLMAQMPKAGKVVDTQKDPATGMTTLTLSNGVKVSYRQNAYNDNEVQFTALSDGGFSLLSDDEWRRSQWALGALELSGVNGLSNTQVSQLLAGKKITVGFNLDVDSHGIQGKYGPKDAELAFQMMYSLIHGVNKNPAVFENYKTRMQSSTANYDADRQKYFDNQVELNINRNNPRFSGLYPNAKAWAETSYDATYDAYKKIFGNANGMHFTFVGAINPTQLRHLSEQYLGGLPSDLNETPRFNELPFREDYSPRTIEIKKGKDKLSQVRIMFGGAAQFDFKKGLRMRVLGDVLEERLINQLREEQGGVYSASVDAGMKERPSSSYGLEMAFPCAPERADELTASAIAQLNDIIKNGPTQSELEKVRKAMITSFEKYIKSNDFNVAGYAAAIQLGHDPSSVNTYVDRVKAITTSQIQQVAAEFFNVKPVVAVLKPE